QPVSDTIDSCDVVRVSTNDLCTTVVDNVLKIVREQSIIDWHQHRADLGNCVVRLQVGVRVRCDIGNSIPLLASERLERRRPPVAAVDKLRVCQTQIPIHYSFTIPVEPARTPSEIHGG